MNPTDNSVTINLANAQYLDLDSTIICGSITLLPYTSKILINANVVCTTSFDQITTEKGISIYPNPAIDVIKIIGTPGLSGSSYTIIDSYGRIVVSGLIQSDNEVVNIENLSKGIYFVSVRGVFNTTKKFVKY